MTKTTKIQLRLRHLFVPGLLTTLLLGACEAVTIGQEEDSGTPDAGEPEDGSGGSGQGGETTPPNNQLDVLLVVDNSISMAEKHKLLESSIPKLLEELLTPPEGKEDAPIEDVHFGVISSSLGGHGSPQCARDYVDENRISYAFDDRGHLIAPSREANASASERVLSWTGGSASERDAFAAQLGELVLSVDDRGCGFEAPLEAMYRFLVDPTPPQEIVLEGTRAIASEDDEGTPLVDQDLLEQRAAFLRSQSSVAIVMLTDEDDCSAMDGGTYYINAEYGWLVTDAARPMVHPTPTCAENPNDACCFSCLQAENPPSGCEADAAFCEGVGTLPPASDRANVRCFNGKQRFGAELLYPVDRYVDALTKKEIVDARTGEMVQNPLLAGRDPSRVFFTGIVGVPWQDAATPDSLEDPEKLRYLSGARLKDADELLDGKTRWDLMLGQPGLAASSHLCPSLIPDSQFGTKSDEGAEGCGEAPVPPLDPFMIASIAPRESGATHPLTGDAIVSATSNDPFANTINGHEANHRVIDPKFADGNPANDDLQYACIFERSTSIKECTPEDADCDCGDEPSRNRPLCQPPEGGPATTTQYFENAYPAPRILQVLQGIGDNAVVASICPKNLKVSKNSTNFGYNAAMRALGNQLWSTR